MVHDGMTGDDAGAGVVAAAPVPLWQRRYRVPIVGFPTWSRHAPNRLVYVSSESGIYQLHSWDLATGERRQITHEPVGLVSGEVSAGAGMRHYPGQVRNGNSFWVKSTRAVLTVYGPLGTVINAGSAATSPTRIGPGGQASFEIRLSGHVAGENRRAWAAHALRETGCDPAYPTVCIPPPPPDLDCGDIAYRDFVVLPPDPHGFDADGDGIGCETT